MGSTVNCCSTVEEKSNEPKNETTSEQTTPFVYSYPALSHNAIPRSLSDTTIRVYPTNLKNIYLNPKKDLNKYFLIYYNEYSREYY